MPGHKLGRAGDPTDERAKRVCGHFLEVAKTARANCIGDLVYIVISDEERQSFPELDGAYGIALDGSKDDREPQYAFFQSESEFDDEVLAALAMCGDGLSTEPTRLQ
jgi:hypothetical protein